MTISKKTIPWRDELKPLSDRVLVVPIEEGDTRHGSIFIPDMGREKPLTGEVVAVGPGRKTDFGAFIEVTDCQPGDIVLLPKLITIQVRFQQKTYYLVRATEILAVIKKKNDE